VVWGANEEADDGAFALVNGDAEAVPPAGCMAVISKRPVGPEVGDECQVRHAEGTVVRSVHPVNFRDKLQGAKHYRSIMPRGHLPPWACSMGTILAVAVGEAKSFDHAGMVHGDALQAQRRYLELIDIFVTCLVSVAPWPHLYQWVLHYSSAVTLSR